MKKTRSILSIMLCLIMLLSSLPVSAIAATTNNSFVGYTPISTKEDLNTIRNNLSGKYYLTNDIVFLDEDFSENGSFYNSGAGWNPIGTFTGTFDGNGYKIKNLYVNASTTNNACVGLFSYNNGTIQNVGLVDCNIVLNLGQTYANTVNGYIGSIAGYNRGTIQNCYNLGTVNGYLNASATTSSASMYIGGIVGCNSGTAVVNNSANLGEVLLTTKSFFSNTYSGGIAGYSLGSVCESYNTGNIKIIQTNTANAPNIYSGGIVGYLKNDGSVIDSYNTGNISIDINSKFGHYAYTGGIVGYMHSGNLENTYNIGEFDIWLLPLLPDEEFRRTYAVENTGGVIGEIYSNNDSVTNCFYINTFDMGIGYGTATTIKCSSEQMKSEDTFVGFNFDEIWTIYSDTKYLYPRLQNNIYFNDEEDAPITGLLKYGLNRLSFGADINGYIDTEVDTLLVYVSDNEDITSLNITSSNTDIVEIGTIEVGVGDYITTENEHKATVPLKLKAEGNAKITVISSEGLTVSVNVNVKKTDQQEPEVETKGFSAKEHGWSFVNGSEGFGYESSYYIPVERYATVFGEEYVAAATAGDEIFNSMIPTERWGGNCYGMSTTSVLFYLGMLDWSNYDELYDNDFSTVNSYYSTLRYHYEFAGLLKWAYASSDINTTVTNLIECYQILQYGAKSGYKAEKGSTLFDLENNYYVLSASTNDRKIYSHNPSGNYISSIYDRIIETNEPLLVDMHGEVGGHSMVIRTDLKPAYCGNGWYKVYVYDPNHPYISDSSVTEKYDLASYYLNLDEDDTYIEINPNENKWRYNGSTNSNQSSSYWGCDENYNVKTYQYTGGTIIPEYMFVYSISDIGYPTEFNGTEEWKSRYLNEASDCSSISFTGNSNFEVVSINGDKIFAVTNGIPYIFDDKAEYFSYVGYVEDASETFGGKLTIPYKEFVIKYISGDDISIIDNDSVINIACDGRATITASMNNNDINIESNADNKIITQITDVGFEKGYTSVYADGKMENGDSINLKLKGDSLIINDTIEGSGSLDIYTDNETMVNDKYITTVPSFNNSVTIPDVRNIVNVSSVSVTPTQKTMTAKGEQFALNVNIVPSNATNKTVLYSSSNSEVATVDPNTGIVTAVSNGTAIITVTTEDGYKKATCIVTVNIPHIHIYDTNNWECNEISHWYECTDCHEVIEQDFHSGGTATCTAQAVCSVCGNLYGVLASHTYTAETKKAETLKSAGNCRDHAVYYYSCSACGKVENNDSHTFLGDKVATSHIGGTELVNQAEANHKTQTGGYTGDTKCLGCNEIIAYGQTIPADAHTPANVWSNDSEYHWKECNIVGCGTVIDGSKVVHSSTGTNVATCQKKAVCDICGVTYGDYATCNFATTYSKDESGHWHACQTAGCSEKDGFATHTPDHQGSATEEYAIKCTICQYEIEAQLGHTHAHSTEWKSDKDNHWNECACGDKANTAAHSDTNNDGKCDTCGHNVGLPADPSSPQTGDNSMISLWIILLCVSALGIVATTVLSKKKSFR